MSPTNNSQRPGSSRLPKARRWSRGARLFAALGAVLVLGAAGGTGWYLLAAGHSARTDLLWHKVRREKLPVTILERGTLESAENRDLVCRVKAGSKNSTVSTTIKWVIDDGSYVEAGTKLIELDSSGLENQLQAQQIVVDQARALFIAADKNLDITISQNVTDIETAKLKLKLAEMDLKKWLAGDYEQAKKDIKARQVQAESDLEMWQERAAWSERMSRQGRRYVTVAQAESDHARMLSAELALKKIREELRVLDDPKYGTKKRMETELEGNIAEAKRAVDRTEKQAIAKEATADADRKSKETVLVQQEAQLRDIEQEIRKCTMYAPQTGLVVYFVPEQSRFNSGSQQSIVAQGEPVREGQKIIRIPNLDKMLVNTKVHEAMVDRVKGEEWKATGLSQGVQAALFTPPDPWSRLTAQAFFTDRRGDFIENGVLDDGTPVKDREMVKVRDGQEATIRIDAFPGKTFKGHVKTVARVASQQDWLSSDVKVYQTMVSIDESVPNLRPGMSAEVVITIDGKPEDVLTIPVQAILGGPEMGPHRKCFVKTPKGPVERDIEIGLSNDQMAEVRSGLQEGDEVVLNPRVLLSDKDKARLIPARPKGKGKGKGKGGFGGPGGPGGPDGQGGKGDWQKGGKGKNKGNWPKDGNGGRPNGGDKGPWSRNGSGKNKGTAPRGGDSAGQ